MREQLIQYLTDLYNVGKNNKLKWKNIFANNMINNPIDGIYAEVNIKYEDKWRYYKYTIEYKYRVDEDCITHPEEGVKYYVLYELILENQEKKIIIPKPASRVSFDNWKALLVNSYGHLLGIFDDEETPKKAVNGLICDKLYPYMYILTTEEQKELYKRLDIKVEE